MNQITIFGMGCEETRSLEDKIYKAVLMLNLQALVGRNDNVNSFLEFHLQRIPALMINNEVVLYGDSPDEKELIELLKERCNLDPS